MKRRLNILCVIVVLVLSYSVFETGYYFIVGVKAGVEAGIDGNASEASQKKLMNMKLNFLHIVICVWSIVLFVRLVISINKSDIFNWKNVHRLRLLGAALIISFCTALLPAYLTFRSVGNVFSVHGYELHLSDTVNTTTLVLGISTLIVAEVFAIGLKMKEEQDLTI